MTHDSPDANARLAAFCDGVFAIALTLLIVDVRIPEGASTATSAELWRALARLAPTVFAFLLSFVIIFITWVNHHGALKLVRQSSSPFFYANALLLLTVVFIPFPTVLLGAYITTDHAAPAVVLYDAVLAVQAIGWLLLTAAALRGGLVRDEESIATMREAHRNGYFALALYGLLAIAAFWFPVVVAILTTMSWLFWLTLSVRLRHS